MLDCHKLPAYFSHHDITSWSLDPLHAKFVNNNTLRGRWLESRQTSKKLTLSKYVPNVTC